MTQIRTALMAADGDLAPPGTGQLELELTCRTHVSTKQKLRKNLPPTQLRSLLFSCVNTHSFAVLLKAEPLLWAFMDPSQLQLITTTAEVVTLYPLKHRYGSDFEPIQETQHWERHQHQTDDEYITRTAHRGRLHLLLNAEDRAKLLVWLDGLLMNGAC